MCGVSGFWEPKRAPASELAAQGERMARTLAHRGPDDSGVWVDEHAGVVLAHRRLSIVDLSTEGHQPMLSPSGRYVLAFNGEIYNFRSLRAQLEAEAAAPAWRGHSDTEVMLAAFERWGVSGALQRLLGMFAFALWDRQARALHLARDRLGEKPLYYGWSRGCLLFGSELKALRAHPAFETGIDPDALALYMQLACVPAPRSIHSGTNKLPAASCLTFTWNDLQARRYPEPRPYWSLRDAVHAGLEHPFRGSDREAADELDRLLREAVGAQMVADVPLGAFLSGGVDSSTIVALMQAQSAQPVKTFTIGFLEDAYNEAAYAKQVARHLRTDHTELYVTPEQTLGVVPRLPELYDEPFADSSQIPTFLVSQLARRQVTVSLSGDAGDELFGGYNRYQWAGALRRSVGWMPSEGRRAIAALLVRVAPARWDQALETVTPLLPARLRHKSAGDKAHKLARLLQARDDNDLYRRLVSLWPAEVVLGAGEPAGWWAREVPAPLRALPERMMALDTLGYLPDDILVKVDRAAMGVSLETRVPLLDHRVVEFVWRLPLAMKIRDGRSKWLLRQVLYRYVPAELIERQKMGFSIPLDRWLRGPLRDWAEALLDEPRLSREGFLDAAAIRGKWREHLSGARSWQHHLWTVLMFQAWLERWQ